MSEIIDSLDETHSEPTPPLYDLYHGLVIAAGQSFTGDGRTLDHAKFYLARAGSPTGSIYAKLYDHDAGTFGVNGKPTGAYLAISDAFDVSTLPDSNPTLVTFNFSTPYRLTNGTHYVLVVEADIGDSQNKVYFFSSESDLHAGNEVTYAFGSWGVNATNDAIFYALSHEGVISQKDSWVHGAG